MISNGMEPEKKSNGALIGLVVIIIILIIGGIYVWISNNKADITDVDIQTESLSTTNSATDSATDSVELNTLEQEVDVTDTDVGANAIDSVQ